LDEEELASPPPEDSQLVIATPERLDAIMRNPNYEPWIDSVRAVCLDEAHLVSDWHRGPTMEFVVTSFLTMVAPPRLVLLSATMGDLDAARRWLAPCDVIEVAQREPPLKKEVVALEQGDDTTEVVVAEVEQALAPRATSVLVFVYQTTSAVKLARELTERLGGKVGSSGALPYHAQMSYAQRTGARAAYERGESRVVVSTTALSLGVNLPATHVIVRDTNFYGEGKLDAAQLLQMLGRAGRGDRKGHGIVVVKPSDGWRPDELAQALRREVLPAFTSVFAGDRRHSGAAEEPPAARIVAALLARSGDRGRSVEEIAQFVERSLAGSALISEVEPAIDWLMDPAQVLAFRDDMDRLQLTKLGLAGVRSAVPLQFTAGVGRLTRDLLVVEPDDRTLQGWTALDSLLVVELLAPNPPTLRAFSEKLVEEIEDWAHGAPLLAPILFRRWIRGSASASKADEVLGSLGVTAHGGERRRTNGRDLAQRAMLRAVVLWQRSQGLLPVDIERQWKTKPGLLEGIEERWRDTDLWLLAGLTRIFDSGCFHYHLRTDCAANHARITAVRDALKKMRRDVYDLMRSVQRCSPLAPLLNAGRVPGTKSPVGLRTVEKLEEAGIRSMAQLAPMTTADLMRLGLHQKAARAVAAYLESRQRG
jgi:hypothetical protein